MKRETMAGLIAMVAIIVVAMFAGCGGKKITETPTPTANELEEFMAQAIIDDCRSPEGAFVAHVVSTSTSRELISPLRIWRYEQGHLVDGDRDALLLAITSSQSSDWPPFVFLYAFSSVKPDYAEVHVHTLYDMGLTPGSRGGNAAVWELEKQNGQWAVVSKNPYLFWD